MKKVVLMAVILSLLIPTLSSKAAGGKVEGRIGSKTFKICDKGYKLDVAPFQSGQISYFPVRFFADRFGAEVVWDGVKKICTVKGFGIDFMVDFLRGEMTNQGSPLQTGERPIISSDRGFVGVKAANISFKMNFTVNNKNIASEVDCDRIKYRWVDFNLPVDHSESSEMVQLSKVLSNGKTKVVVLEFWYTACTHCWDQLKHLETLHQKYKDRGLEIFSITTDGPDNEASRWEKIEELGYTYKTLLDTKAETYAGYFQPVFPNITVIVPGEKFYTLRRDPLSKGDNDELEKLIENLCTPN